MPLIEAIQSCICFEVFSVYVKMSRPVYTTICRAWVYEHNEQQLAVFKLQCDDS